MYIRRYHCASVNKQTRFDIDVSKHCVSKKHTIMRREFQANSEYAHSRSNRIVVPKQLKVSFSFYRQAYIVRIIIFAIVSLYRTYRNTDLKKLGDPARIAF